MIEQGGLRPVSVSELNEYLKAKLEQDYILKGICVAGELSNYVAHSSGHSYFTLKDGRCALRAVMFKGYKQLLDFVPKTGMSVLAVGDVSIYPRDGVYQLYVTRLLPTGVGELFMQFEQVKRALEQDGLLEDARKRPLPRFVRTVGVVTSPEGAVIQDIKNVIARRYPLCRVVLYPCAVQGVGAAAGLAAGLRALDARGDCDVIILARGGGSMEDLWAFNDEKLARTIAACRAPVVSAVGHQTDYTIADFVADLRAPTPSAAAELITPDQNELRLQLAGLLDRFDRTLCLRIEAGRARVRTAQLQLRQGILAGGAPQRARLEAVQMRMGAAAATALRTRRERLAHLCVRLESANPLAILRRGFAFVETKNGSVASVRELNTGELVVLHFADGIAHAQICKKDEGARV